VLPPLFIAFSQILSPSVKQVVRLTRSCIGLSRNRLMIRRLSLKGHLQSFNQYLFSPNRDSLQRIHFYSPYHRVL